MDPKSIGRSWVGNIYNKFETIFHEVDEFVTKDTAKYFENQVQAVNEDVKKLYSNMQGDKVENKAQEVAETKDDTTGDSILSMVGVKESSTYISETQISEEPVVDSLTQLSLSPGASFSEDTVNGSHLKEGSDANDLCNPDDKFSSSLSSADEEYKCAGFVKHSPAIVVSDDRISRVSMMKTIDDYAYLSQKVKAKPSLKQDVTALEVSPTMEHPQVDFRSASNNGSSSNLPFLFTEEHLTTEKPSLMKDENLCKIKLISATNDLTLDGQLSSGTSVHGEWFRILENDEEVPSVTRLSGEAESDLCFNNYQSFMLPELGPEKNSLVQKHALKEQLCGYEDSCDISVQSKAPSVGTEDCNSPKYESSSVPLLISLPKQQITTIFAKLLPASEDQKTGPRPLHGDDKATYAVCNGVMSTCNVQSDQESSNISELHHVVKSDASSSSLSTKLLHANGVEETEEMCYDYTHNSCSAADSPTAAFISLSDVGTCGETGSQIPSFSSTSSTASGHFQSLTCLEKHDLAVDTVDADDLLETINLSDEPKLEDICSMVDNELLYTPSFRYRRRFGSYKELIKEAFASRKRRVKEYQQLPIWYGDFDSENSPNSEKHLSPQTAVSEASTSTLTSSHPCDISESDWELL